MKLVTRLSDKILIIVFVFTTAIIPLVKYVIGASNIRLLIFSYAVYNMAFIMTYVVSRRFSKRMVDLTFKIEEMAAGNLSKKLTAQSHDEIGQLTVAINELMSRLMTGIAQDVSVRKELAKAKTDFVTIASHQLRTPLSIVKWYVDYMLGGDSGELNVEQKQYLEEVYRSNERLIELVNALLDVSRIDVGTFSIEPEPTDIIERAETAINRFMPEIEKKQINLEKEFDEFPPIDLDPRLTKIVFENIFSNSVKYTPEKGTIRFVIKRADKNLLIKISDTGLGIPREEQPRIFTKLFRAANAKKIESAGTGLGLYIVKAVIEKSGGKIWFQSPSLDLLMDLEAKGIDVPLNKQNRGTTFFITIPMKGMRKKHGTKKLTSVD